MITDERCERVLDNFGLGVNVRQALFGGGEGLVLCKEEDLSESATVIRNRTLWPS